MATIFIEPHPSPYTNTTTHHAILSSGRGGAGNYHTYPREILTDGSNATGPASASTSLKAKASAAINGTASAIANVANSNSNSNSSSSCSSSTSTTPPQKKTDQQRRASASPRVMTGRGGAGNLRPVDERRAYDFNEELGRERSRSKSVSKRAASRGRSGSVVHVGRGGAGNAVVEEDEEGDEEDARRAGSVRSGTSRGTTGSGSSFGSVDGGWRRRLGRVLSRE